MKKLRDNKITASRKLAACAIALLQLFYYMRKPSRRPLAAKKCATIFSICVLTNANCRLWAGIAANVPQPYFSAGKNSTEQHKSTKL